MAFDAHANFGYSLVATAPAPALSGTSLTVATGEGALFPAAPFNCSVWPVGTIPITTNAEIIRVTAVTGDVLTIVRAQEGTAARSIIIGDQIANTITAKVITDIEAEVPGPMGSQGPAVFTWALDGSCVLLSQSSFKKTVDNGLWDSGARSLEGHVRGVFMTTRPLLASTYAMIGLNSDPTLDADYTSLDYAFYIKGDEDMDIYESGVYVGAFGAYTTSTILAITYDGENVRYWKDGVIQRTVVRAIGSALYLDSSIASVDAGFQDVHFGPMGEKSTTGTLNPDDGLYYNWIPRVGDIDPVSGLPTIVGEWSLV